MVFLYIKWTPINELDKLAKLQELRLRLNPLNESDRLENIRQMVIARIGGLKMFNRTLVGGQERKGAEIDYMKHFGKQWLDLVEQKCSKDAFNREHPRYGKLIECRFCRLVY